MTFKALPEHVARLKADLAGLLGKDDSDVVLLAEGKEHQAHRAILKARSPVLHAMLEADMSEKASGRINIQDMDSVTVALLLHFLYTADLPPQVGDQPGAPEMLGRLMKAADKYEVPNLVELCVAWMKRELTIGNLLKILEVAHDFGHEGLKRTCLEMATSGEDTLQAVQDSDDFESLPPELVREMFVFAHGNNRRRKADALEFPSGTQWAALSRVQLQRACDERSLANCAGDRDELARRLESWEAARPF
jgi:speckle-type POZ protein